MTDLTKLLYSKTWRWGTGREGIIRFSSQASQKPAGLQFTKDSKATHTPWGLDATYPSEKTIKEQGKTSHARTVFWAPVKLRVAPQGLCSSVHACSLASPRVGPAVWGQGWDHTGWDRPRH